MGYRGARMVQDNCLWKPPGARSLGMHQDASYAGYLVPQEMITCWVALDDTQATGGTIEHVRGSHLWPKTPPDRGSFHAPEDWLAPVTAATPEGVEPERVPGRRQGGRLRVPPRLDLPRLRARTRPPSSGARSSRTWCRSRLASTRTTPT